jgi:hypothetical protein
MLKYRKKLSSEAKTGNHNYHTLPVKNRRNTVPDIFEDTKKKIGRSPIRKIHKKNGRSLIPHITSLKTKYSGLKLFTQRYDLPFTVKLSVSKILYLIQAYSI